MKKYLFSILFLAMAFAGKAQVAINETGNAPNDNAILDISSTTKGLLIPRVTTTERTNMDANLAATEDGLTVYDTDTKSFWYWNGTGWSTMGSNGTVDQDWFKEGTSDSPTDINDKMFHMGDVAIGKNTADYKLDVFEDAKINTMKVGLSNPDTAPNLRTVLQINADGVAPTSYGKMGIYATVGGDPGNHSWSSLVGMEVDIYGDDDIHKPQYGYATDIAGNNNGSHVGLYNWLHGDGGGARYGVLNWIENNTTANIYSNYTYISNNSDGIHFGDYYRIGGAGNGSQYGSFHRIFNAGTGYQVGVLNELKTAGEQIHVGTYNILGAGAHEDNPFNIEVMTNDGNAKRIGNYNRIAGNGGGQHYGTENQISSTGDGDHIGTYNVVGPDGAGKHIAVYGEVDATDTAAMAGVFKGDVTARNYITNLTFLSANDDVRKRNDTYEDEDNIGSVLDPTLINKEGKIEVKLVLRITDYDGNTSDHNFRLHAVNDAQDIFPIVETDSWTWTSVGDYYLLSSGWVAWDAGTDPWSLILNDNQNDERIYFDQVYLLIRPQQP